MISFTTAGARRNENACCARRVPPNKNGTEANTARPDITAFFEPACATEKIHRLARVHAWSELELSVDMLTSCLHLATTLTLRSFWKDRAGRAGLNESVQRVETEVREADDILGKSCICGSWYNAR